MRGRWLPAVRSAKTVATPAMQPLRFPPTRCSGAHCPSAPAVARFVSRDAAEDAFQGDVELAAVGVVGGDDEVGAVFRDEVVDFALRAPVGPLDGVEDGDGMAALVA